MGYPIHPLSNVGVAGQYLNQLTSDNISQRYFSGQQSYTGGFFNRFKLFFNINGTLKQLQNFYPYVPIVQKSVQNYTAQRSGAITTGLIITGLSWFTIFNLARRGKVLPFFNQYDSFFKTHRIFRQYLFTLIAPATLLTGAVNWHFLNHTEHLWGIHSRRMNQQLISDPDNSQYPEQLLPTSWTGSWMRSYVDKFDLKKKNANQVELLIAPDYAQPQYQNQQIPDESAEGQQEEQ